MGLPCLRLSLRVASLTVFICGLVVLTVLNLGWYMRRYSQHGIPSSLGRNAESLSQLIGELNGTNDVSASYLNDQLHNPQSILDSSLDREMKRRLALIDAACTRRKVSRQAKRYNAQFFDHLLVLDPYKLLFNFIPKVSCTTWKKLLGELMVRANATEHFTTLNKYTTEERNWRLDTYKKAVFVREPLSRLLSAWMDKFRDNPKDKKRWEKYFGKQIVKRYRQGVHDASGRSLRWLNVTFTEFSQFVARYGPQCEIDAISDHFVPQNEICNPCQLNYHFIGHFENLAVEGPYFLRWISADHLVSFPRFHPSAASRSFKEEIARVPIKALDGLAKLYKRDYEMFGYSFENTLDILVND
ncbi:carbohydrate sulfotransferase 14-like [Patiria miniata]|uniref:Carbohydrate sulfotransferase n=1 Tax=Patiria miniata TaxID=46514 RepID=A0A914A939_PATMI|nr:carbohydrate sulfotransferase 14-like [Patiria miniata]